VSVVARGGFVLDVRSVDRDTTGLFFRRVVDLRVVLGFTAEVLGQHGGDSSSQGGLTVVNVANGAHVHVWLGALELFFCHFFDSEKNQMLTMFRRNHLTQKHH